jgi:hypothetical protein
VIVGTNCVWCGDVPASGAPFCLRCWVGVVFAVGFLFGFVVGIAVG